MAKRFLEKHEVESAQRSVDITSEIDNVKAQAHDDLLYLANQIDAIHNVSNHSEARNLQIIDPLTPDDFLDIDKQAEAKKLLNGLDYKDYRPYPFADKLRHSNENPFVEIDYELFTENFETLKIEEKYLRINDFFNKFSERLDAISLSENFLTDPDYVQKYFDLSYFLLAKGLGAGESKINEYHQKQRSKLLSYIPSITKAQKVYEYLISRKDLIAIKEDLNIFSACRDVSEAEIIPTIDNLFGLRSNAARGIALKPNLKRQDTLISALRSNPSAHVAYFENYDEVLTPEQAKEILIGSYENEELSSTESFWHFHNHEKRLDHGENYRLMPEYFQLNNPNAHDDIKTVYAHFLEQSTKTLAAEFTGKTSKDKELGPLYEFILPVYFEPEEISAYITTMNASSPADTWRDIGEQQKEWLMEHTDVTLLIQTMAQQGANDPTNFIEIYNGNVSFRALFAENAAKENEALINSLFDILTSDPNEQFKKLTPLFQDVFPLLSAEQQQIVLEQIFDTSKKIFSINNDQNNWLKNEQNVDQLVLAKIIFERMKLKMDDDFDTYDFIENKASQYPDQPKEKFGPELVSSSVDHVSEKTKDEYKEIFKENPDLILDEFSNGPAYQMQPIFEDIMAEIYTSETFINEVLTSFNEKPASYWSRIGEAQKDWLLNPENIETKKLAETIIFQGFQHSLDFGKYYTDENERLKFTEFIDELLGELQKQPEENEVLIKALIALINQAVEEAEINDKLYSDAINEFIEYVIRNYPLGVFEAMEFLSKPHIQAIMHRYANIQQTNKFTEKELFLDNGITPTSDRVLTYKGAGMHSTEWKWRIFDEIIRTRSYTVEEVPTTFPRYEKNHKTGKYTKAETSMRKVYKVNPDELKKAKDRIDAAKEKVRENNGQYYFKDRNVRMILGSDDQTGTYNRETVNNLFNNASILEPAINRQNPKSLQFYEIDRSPKTVLDYKTPAEMIPEYQSMRESALKTKEEYLSNIENVDKLTSFIFSHGTGSRISLLTVPKDFRLLQVAGRYKYSQYSKGDPRRDETDKSKFTKREARKLAHKVIQEVYITPNDLFEAYKKRKENFPESYNDIHLLGNNCFSVHYAFLQQLRQHNSAINSQIQELQNKIKANPNNSKLSEKLLELENSLLKIPKSCTDSGDHFLPSFAGGGAGIRSFFMQNNLQLDPNSKSNSNIDEVINSSWKTRDPGNPAIFLPDPENPYDFLQVSDATRNTSDTQIG